MGSSERERVFGRAAAASRVLALALASCAARTPPPDPLAGTPPASQFADVAVPEHAREIVSYTLTATLDPVAHVVHGEGTLGFTNASSVAIDAIYLHLYLDAFKNERSLFLRDRAGNARGGAAVADWGYVDVKRFAFASPDGAEPNLFAAKDRAFVDALGDETDVRVPLGRVIAPGDHVVFELQWDAKLPSIVERTGHAGSFHAVAQWFPKIARLEPDGTWKHFSLHHLSEFYSDYGTFDVTIDVPASFVVAATGRTVDERVEGGRRRVRHVQGDVHDFAFFASDRLRETRASAGKVALRCLHPAGYENVAVRELEAARFGLARFGALYGEYPYDVLTLVHPPKDAGEAGGMEYPTLITTGGSWWEPRAWHALELVTLHELGHQWFYGLVGTDEHASPFLDEGLNSYAEHDAARALFGDGSALSTPWLEVSTEAISRAIAASVEHDDVVAKPADEFASGAQYGGLVYARTATVLETLARSYGQAALSRALGRFTRRHRFDHPSAETFFDEMAGDLPKGAGEALRLALAEGGWIDVAVLDASSQKRAEPAGVFDHDGRRETVPAGKAADEWRGSALVVRRGTLALPVDVALHADDGTVRTTTWSGATRFTRVPYVGSSRLRAVEVDPAAKLLLDGDRTNGAAIVDQGARADGTFAALVSAFSLALSAVSP